MARQISSAKNRSFAVKVVFPFDETFEITDVLTSMTVLALKDRIELENIKNPLDRNIGFFNRYFDEESIIYTNWKKLIKC